MKNLTFNTFYYTSPIIILWLIISSFISLGIELFLFSFILLIIAYKVPKIAIYILLFSLPIFGNRPCMEQTYYLILFSSVQSIFYSVEAMLLGLYIYDTTERFL